MIPSDEMLARIAGSLRQVIGPAVGDDYPRTQAFLASVILEKSSRQVRMSAAHALADDHDRMALSHDLAAVVAVAAEPLPVAVMGALDMVEVTGGNRALATLVDAIYAAQPELDPALFATLLGRVRLTLRAQLDRRSEVGR